MKKVTQLFTLSVATLFLACGSTTPDSGINTTSTSRTTSTTSSKTIDTPTANPRTPTVGENGNGNRQLSINNTNPEKVEPINQADYDLQRTTNMYTSLNMTEDQIQRYETASRTSMDAWKSSNAQRTMTIEQRMETQDATVKAILDASQYKNYQQWLKDNPYRN